MCPSGCPTTLGVACCDLVQIGSLSTFTLLHLLVEDYIWLDFWVFKVTQVSWNCSTFYLDQCFLNWHPGSSLPQVVNMCLMKNVFCIQISWLEVGIDINRLVFLHVYYKPVTEVPVFDIFLPDCRFESSQAACFWNHLQRSISVWLAGQGGRVEGKQCSYNWITSSATWFSRFSFSILFILLWFY